MKIRRFLLMLLFLFFTVCIGPSYATLLQITDGYCTPDTGSPFIVTGKVELPDEPVLFGSFSNFGISLLLDGFDPISTVWEEPFYAGESESFISSVPGVTYDPLPDPYGWEFGSGYGDVYYTSEPVDIYDVMILSWEAVELSLVVTNPAIGVQYTFDIVAEAAPVPEPATMLLLGSGLAGLVGYRRKSKKRKL